MRTKFSVTHLSSAHLRFDTRIFHKMCCSLVNQNYSVNLVVADGKGNETCEGVKILDAGSSRSRFDRIINATDRVFNIAVEQDSDLYHFHDPELIPTGLKLKKCSKPVIFDSVIEYHKSPSNINFCGFFKKVASSGKSLLDLRPFQLPST